MDTNPLDNLRQHTMLCKVTATVCTGASKASFFPEIESAHKEIMRAQAEARTALYDNSMAYGDDTGWRVLPYELVAEFGNAFKIAKQRYTIAFNILHGAIMPSLDEGAAHLDYNPAEICGAYMLEFRFSDYPAGVFAGAGNRQDRLIAALNRDLMAVITGIKREVMERAIAPMQHMVDRLTAYDARTVAQTNGEDVGKTGSFRDNTVNDVHRALAHMKHFNFSGDERIAEVYDKCLPILGMTPADIRQDADKRGVAILAASEAALACQHYLNGGVNV